MTILVGYDGTTPARAALAEAARLAHLHDAPLHIFWHQVHELGDSPTRARDESVKSLAAADELDGLERRYNDRGIATTTTLTHGAAASTAAELLALADAIDAEIIVLGLTERSRVERLVLGSVLEAVMARSTCPVMTVRPPVDDG